MTGNRFSDYPMPGGDGRLQPQAIGVALPPNVVHPAASDLYAMAWMQAVRDHEIDKLFNSAFDYEI